MKSAALIAAACLAVTAAGPAAAAPITLAFAGTVTQTPLLDPHNPFGGPIDTGTPFTGRITFDPASADAVPDGRTGSYSSAGAPYGLSVSFGSPSVFDAGFDAVHIGIGDDFAGTDFYTVAAPLGVVAGGLSVSLLLADADGTVFAGDALPAGAPPLAAFESNQFSLAGVFVDANGEPIQIEILGAIDSLRCSDGCVVPEPGGLWLLAAGLAGLAGRRRRPTSP